MFVSRSECMVGQQETENALSDQVVVLAERPCFHVFKDAASAYLE